MQPVEGSIPSAPMLHNGKPHNGKPHNGKPHNGKPHNGKLERLEIQGEVQRVHP